MLNAAAGNSPSRSADVTYSYHHNRFTYTLNSGFNGTQMHMDYFDERSTLENDSLEMNRLLTSILSAMACISMVVIL